MSDKRKKMPRPLAVGDLLAAVFCDTPTEKRLGEGKIWLVWDAAVGKQIAAKAQPASFRDGTLTVAVASAPWMHQLSFLKKQLMEKINELLGGEVVREIYLKAGQPQPLSHQARPRKKQARCLTEEETRRIGEQTASVSDPELREVIARILKRDIETRAGKVS
jgi:predicted nucleic acid-binding Zn ribbon protein